jgi:hypothetical protein
MRLALGSNPDVRLAARAKQAEAKALKRSGVDPVHAKMNRPGFELTPRSWNV